MSINPTAAEGTSRALHSEARAREAEMLRSEGLKGPKRAEKRKPKAGACRGALNHRRLAIVAEDFLEGVGDLLHRRVGPDCLEDRVHGVAFATGRFLQLFEALFDPVVIAALFEGLEAFGLSFRDLRVHAVELHILLVLGFVDVDVDHVALVLFEFALVAGRGLGDLTHREALLYGLYHAPHLVYLPEVVVGLPL